MNPSGIYAITCIKTGKQYVGSAKHIWNRWKDHRKHLKQGDHANIHLQRAWDKYGSAEFGFSVLEDVLLFKDLVEREQHWIDTLKPKFNICQIAGQGAHFGWKHTEAGKENISKANKAYWANLSDEERAERGKNSTHAHTDETKKLLAKLTKKQIKEKGHPRQGAHLSKKARKTISQKLTGRKTGPRSAAVKRKIAIKQKERWARVHALAQPGVDQRTVKTQ